MKPTSLDLNKSATVPQRRTFIANGATCERPRSLFEVASLSGGSDGANSLASSISSASSTNTTMSKSGFSPFLTLTASLPATSTSKWDAKVAEEEQSELIQPVFQPRLVIHRPENMTARACVDARLLRSAPGILLDHGSVYAVGYTALAVLKYQTLYAHNEASLRPINTEFSAIMDTILT
jgi:hypothetical protein